MKFPSVLIKVAVHLFGFIYAHTFQAKASHPFKIQSGNFARASFFDFASSFHNDPLVCLGGYLTKCSVFLNQTQQAVTILTLLKQLLYICSREETVNHRYNEVTMVWL